MVSDLLLPPDTETPSGIRFVNRKLIILRENVDFPRNNLTIETNCGKTPRAHQKGKKGYDE